MFWIIDVVSIVMGFVFLLCFELNFDSDVMVVICLVVVGIYSLIVEFMVMYWNW